MDQIIANHSLHIDQAFESFINNFCSTQGANFPQGRLGNYLGSWYEGYLYCLMIGLNTNSRHYAGYEKKVQKVDRWSLQNLNQYKYCIARVMSKEDIRTELGIDSRDNIKATFISKEDLIRKVKEICDQFSLGGVRYLKELYDNDPSIFNDPLSLKTIYEKSMRIN